MRGHAWILRAWALLAGALLVGEAGHAGEHSFTGLIDLRVLSSDGDRVWLDGGLDKVRFGSDDEPVALGAALLAYQGRLTPTLTGTVVASAYDRVDHAIDVTEAFLHYRPVPRSAYRFRLKAGAFYPPVSLENVAPGWTSPYTLSFSSVNSWIAEEIRTLGLELEATRMGRYLGSVHDLSLHLALFQGNDPAGALISWRGWSLHDRQTRLFERLPLADLPAFGPDGSFPPQEAYEEPFTEIDGRTGFYVAGQWDAGFRSRLRLLRYDNRGDPLAVEDGQWAWRTRFWHLGWQLRGPGGSDVILQVLDGDTEMAGFTGTLVYTGFRSAALLVSRSWRENRVSLRYDDFEVEDEDTIPDDPNGEDGHAWTLAWLYSRGAVGPWGGWRLGVELLSVDSSRPAREIFGEPADRSEQIVQLSLGWRL